MRGDGVQDKRPPTRPGEDSHHITDHALIVDVHLPLGPLPRVPRSCGSHRNNSSVRPLFTYLSTQASDKFLSKYFQYLRWDGRRGKTEGTKTQNPVVAHRATVAMAWGLFLD